MYPLGVCILLLGVIVALLRHSHAQSMFLDEEYGFHEIEFQTAIRSSVSTHSIASECDALWTIYESTGGPQWLSQHGWQLGEAQVRQSCCEIQLDGVSCMLGSVVQLNLPAIGLRGSLPDVFSQLPNVTVLGVESNYLTGAIPPSICSLVRLQHLYFSRNTFTGSIPDCIGNLRNLLSFDVGYNRLTGPLPASAVQLDKLNTLDVSANDMTGSFLFGLNGTFDSLKLVLGSKNSFSGRLAANLSLMAPMLQSLYLADNLFDGPIPDSWAQLQSLTVLELGGNNLSGTLPASLGSLPSLMTLDVKRNSLSGAIPSSLCNISSLQFFVCSSNMFTSFPDCSSYPPMALLGLDASNNLLTSFPYDSITQFPRLIAVDLAQNLLTGPFPLPFFMPGMSLRVLSLAYNQLSGPFPIYPCGVWLNKTQTCAGFTAGSSSIASGLSYLDLSGNSVTSFPGTGQMCRVGVPGLLSKCLYCASLYPTLSTLRLAHANVQDQAPFTVVTSSGQVCNGPAVKVSKFLSLFAALVDLDLHGNMISSSLEDLVTLPTLASLDLSRNPATLDTSVAPSMQDQFLFDEDSLYPYSASMACYQAKMAYSGLVIKVDPEFFSFRNCRCRFGYYGKPPHCSSCDGDFIHAKCSVRDTDFDKLSSPVLDWSTSGNVLAEVGYFATPSVTFQQMETNNAYPRALVRCRDGDSEDSACRATSGGPCSDGYRGRLCSQCDVNYVAVGDRCVSCPEGAARVGFTLLIAIAIVVLITFSLFVGSSSSGPVKILFFFFQGLFYIRTRMPTGLYDVLYTSSSLFLFPAPGPECYFSSWDFTDNFVAAALTPLVTILIMTVLWLAGTVWLLFKRKPASLWNLRCARAVVFLLLTQYMSIVTVIISPLTCERDPGDGKDYIISLPYHQCSESLTIASALLGFLYIFGVPVAVFYALFRSGAANPSRPGFDSKRYVFSILFSSFKPRFFFWEIVVIVRRVMFVIAFISLPPASPFGGFMAAAVLMLAVLANALMNPYKSQLDNSLEVLSLSVLIVNYAVSLKSDLPSSSGSSAAGVVVFVLDLLFLLIVAYFLARRAVRRLRRKYVKGSLGSDPTMQQGLLRADDSAVELADQPGKL